MSVETAGVPFLRDENHIGLISDINNSEGILIVTETYFTASVMMIRSIINHTLSIVGVTIIRETASKFGIKPV